MIFNGEGRVLANDCPEVEFRMENIEIGGLYYDNVREDY